MEQKNAPSSYVQQVTETKKVLENVIRKERDNAFQRFPLVFTLLTTFGLVSVLYGFEGIIDRVVFLKDNPIVMLLLGLGILTFTGTLYKSLQTNTIDINT